MIEFIDPYRNQTWTHQSSTYEEELYFCRNTALTHKRKLSYSSVFDLVLRLRRYFYRYRKHVFS